MDLPLRTISYIADIGNMVVLMARGKMVRSRSAQENLEQTAEQTSMTHDDRRMYRMICHVFESEDVSCVREKNQIDQLLHNYRLIDEMVKYNRILVLCKYLQSHANSISYCCK